MGEHAGGSGEGHDTWELANAELKELLGYLKQMVKQGTLDHYEICWARVRYDPKLCKYFAEVLVE